MKRLLRAAGTLPFVKTICRDKTAAPLKALAESRLVDERLASGIDLRSRSFFGPGRNQPQRIEEITRRLLFARTTSTG
jgi:hypothetical protein